MNILKKIRSKYTYILAYTMHIFTEAVTHKHLYDLTRGTILHVMSK